MNVAAIVEALNAYVPGPYTKHGRWVADCPSCGAGRSVRVVDRPNQRLLVFCLAGCSQATILAALPSADIGGGS